MTDTISLRGVRVHNLRGLDVTIPLRKLTIVTGVSGAGKSSLVFDTLFAEAQRRYLQSFSPYVRQFLERFDKPASEFIGPLPTAVALSRRPSARNARATVGKVTEIADYLDLLFARRGQTVCTNCGASVKARDIPDVLTALAALPVGTRVAIGFPSRPDETADFKTWAAGLREEGFVRIQVGAGVFRLEDPASETAVANAAPAGHIWVLVDRVEAGQGSEQRLFDSIETAFSRGQGRLALLSDLGEVLFDRRPICPRCDSDQYLTTFLEGQTIGALMRGSAQELALFIEPLAGDDLVLMQIQRRLALLIAMELEYLTLDRSAVTLAMGEAQRVRLTAVLASPLVGAMYLLDEPTAGLHPRVIGKVIPQLRKLVDAGNTVVLIDPSGSGIGAADHVIDLGPGAGEEGGRLLYQGPGEGLLACTESVTAEFLRQDDIIPVPTKRRPLEHGHLRLRGASCHNLRNLTVDFPLGVLCVVTGVSGAGKSTLVERTLYPVLCRAKHKKTPGEDGANADTLNLAQVHLEGAGQIEDVLLMDQLPLARTSRSNPATYLKIFDEIRETFADTSEARIHNFGPGAFSFNQPGGRCEVCEGQGTLTVDMQFLADVTTICPECQGTRFKKEILNVKVRSLSIAEVLDLTVHEAFRFFRAGAPSKNA